MLYVSDFMRDFYKKLHEVTPEDLQRELAKYERVVKHTLYMIVGQLEHFSAEESSSFQERFHVRVDQLAADYRTWKRAGCKSYARPRQYISGRIAGASKKAFDQILNKYILLSREVSKQENFYTKNISLEPRNHRSTVQESVIQESVIQEPIVREPVVQESMIQEPMVQEPMMQAEMTENIELYKEG